MFYVSVGRGVEEGYLVCTLSLGKTLPGVAKGDHCLLHYPGLLNPPDKHPVVQVQLVLLQEALARQLARQTLDVLRSGWERGRGGLPGLYFEPGKDIARSGGKGDNCLLHHAGLLNPPYKH
jgi:hypothetical protein